MIRTTLSAILIWAAVFLAAFDDLGPAVWCCGLACGLAASVIIDRPRFGSRP